MPIAGVSVRPAEAGFGLIFQELHPAATSRTVPAFMPPDILSFSTPALITGTFIDDVWSMAQIFLTEPILLD